MSNKKSQAVILQQDKNLDKFIIKLPPDMAELFNDLTFTNGKSPQEFIAFCLKLGTNVRLLDISGGKTLFQQPNEEVEVLVFDESEVDND